MRESVFLGVSSRQAVLVVLMLSAIASGCDNTDSQQGRQSITGQPDGIGDDGTAAPMPGLGMMMSGASGGGDQAQPQADGNSGGAAGGAGAPEGGNAGAAGMSMSLDAGAAVDAGVADAGAPDADAAEAGVAGSGAPADPLDPTSVCAGGTVGQDSDSVTTRDLADRRNLAIMIYAADAPNEIVGFKTTLVVPETPSQRSTLFIWPGLQWRGGDDPARVGNGVLQPVLTYGPSCSPRAPANTYASWWISAMYVNLSGGPAGRTGCAGGDSMQVDVGDRLAIEFALDGTVWTQTVTNLSNMEQVDFTTDLEGQQQNWAIWDIEIPASSRPAEDTVFEQSVLTFAQPVTSCEPGIAAEVDYFSAPVLSPDGKNCCIDQIILRQTRN